MREIGAAPDNFLHRDCRARAPNEGWLADVTECHAPARKLYFSPTIDGVDGVVASGSTGMRPDAEPVNTILDAAVETVAAGAERPVLQSDRGGRDRRPGGLSRVWDTKRVRSMFRKGGSPDNSAREGFFGLLKCELLYARDGMSVPIQELVSTLDCDIHSCHDKSIEDLLGVRSPGEHRWGLGIAARPAREFVRAALRSISVSSHRQPQPETEGCAQPSP